MPSSPVTYRDIAAAAGVSVATVSLALRGSDLISGATAGRVRTAAESLGYRPNPLVSALMNSVRSKGTKAVKAIIGIITPNPARRRSRVHPAAREIIDLATAHAESCGFASEEIPLEEVRAAHKDIDRILAARGITGLLLDDAGGLMHTLRLDWDRYSVVRIGSHKLPLGFHTVTADHYGMAATGIGELLARGYRRVGFILTEALHDATAGYALAAYFSQREGLARGQHLSLLRCDEVREGEFVDWLRREGLEAILTPDHRVFHWLKRRGFDVPGKIALAHADVTSRSRWWPFAGVEQDRKTLVSFAVNLLVSECNHNRRGRPENPVWVSVPVRWREGETVRPKG